MSLKDNLGDSISKGQLKPHTQFKPYVSQGYHRFFEGYRESLVMKPDGTGTMIKRIYTGPIYREQISGYGWVLKKIALLLLFLSACSLFIAAAGPSTMANRTGYVTIMEAISVGFFFWMAIGIIWKLLSIRNMEIFQWRSSHLRLIRASKYASIPLICCAVAYFVSMILQGKSILDFEIFHVIYFLISSILVMAIYRIEKKTKYDIEKGNESPDAP